VQRVVEVYTAQSYGFEICLQGTQLIERIQLVRMNRLDYLALYTVAFSFSLRRDAQDVTQQLLLYTLCLVESTSGATWTCQQCEGHCFFGDIRYNALTTIKS
jgi:hypothetical protein